LTMRSICVVGNDEVEQNVVAVDDLIDICSTGGLWYKFRYIEWKKARNWRESSSLTERAIGVDQLLFLIPVVSSRKKANHAPRMEFPQLEGILHFLEWDPQIVVNETDRLGAYQFSSGGKTVVRANAATLQTGRIEQI